MASAGRKLPRSKPRICRSRTHSQSETSLFRPGRFFTCRAFTSITLKPRASGIPRMGIHRPRWLPSRRGHPAGGQPVSQPLQITREGTKRPYRRRVAIRRYRDEVFGGPTVDPGRIRMETLEGAEATLPRLRRRTTAGGVSSEASSRLATASGNRDADEWQSPKRAHAALTTCHQ